MKKILALLVALIGLGCLAGCAERHPEVLSSQKAVATDNGIAIAIVYDNSGSMSDDVRNSKGKNEQKDHIARRALIKVIDSLKAYSDNGGKRMQVGIVKFDGVAVPFSDFNYETLMDWAKKSSNDGLNTPLGVTMEQAIGMVLQSPMIEKHVLVLTDGMSNAGASPQEILSSTEYQSVSSQYPVGIYYVAFDMDNSCFRNLESLGVKLFNATDETQLNKQFSDILQKEILFEDPEQ